MRQGHGWAIVIALVCSIIGSGLLPAGGEGR